MTTIDEVLKKAEKKAARGGSSEGGSRAFEQKLLSLLQIGDRVVRITPQRFGSNSMVSVHNLATDQVFVQVFNVPRELAHGVATDNNRMMFVVDGFSRVGPDEPPPSGKVKVELSIAPYVRGASDAERKSLRIRAKSGTIDVIAKYIADYVNAFVATHEPNL